MALVSVTKHRFIEEWRCLCIDRIQRDGRAHMARIMLEQGVPNVTPGSTEIWVGLIKTGYPHLRFPALADKETVEVRAGDQ